MSMLCHRDVPYLASTEKCMKTLSSWVHVSVYLSPAFSTEINAPSQSYRGFCIFTRDFSWFGSQTLSTANIHYKHKAGHREKYTQSCIKKSCIIAASNSGCHNLCSVDSIGSKGLFLHIAARGVHSNRSRM